MDSISTRLYRLLGFLLVFLTSHALYHYLVTSIGNPAGLTQLIWSFNAEPWVSEATVTLTHLSYILCAVLLIMTIAHTVVDLLAAGFGLSNSGLAAIKLSAQLAQTGLSLDLALDIIIMLSMFHFFYTNRTHIKSTQSLLNKLAFYTFASGSLTVVANAVILAMFVTLPTTQIYSGASFVLPHHSTQEDTSEPGTIPIQLAPATTNQTPQLVSRLHYPCSLYPNPMVKDEGHGTLGGGSSSHEFVPMAIYVIFLKLDIFTLDSPLCTK
ncbi:hypothetical protein Clacol_009688 [Clathrus columnatus]|uniref:DUF6534 domain-containing protein n=1 Tax=Clathrus columnatus TaxID=1419009 RepID=A0AAV5ANN9_9AGAM|nr:hypothetical protein Clacol_009688 [Clathrus columnatus]